MAAVTKPPNGVRREAPRQAAITEDALFAGTLRLLQPAEGYRVNVDALVLAAFAAGSRPAALAVDLGAGIGSVGLTLHHVGAVERLVLIEREPMLVELARRNLALAGATGDVFELDIARGALPPAVAHCADLVICNPPFFDEGAGRGQKHPLTRTARTGELEPFVAAAARSLRGSRGRAAFAYPARALSELFHASKRAGLVPKRLRFVHARLDSPARLALVELRRAKPGGLVVEAPLVEWQQQGVRSPELDAVVEGRFGPLGT
jgi:tRNA1Val (adenine37-N6)-methyltransferase